MMKEFCADLGMARKTCVTESIYQAGIIPVTEVKVTAIEEGKVIGVKDGVETEYPCDYAVIAIGSRSRDGSALKKAALEEGIGYMVIGDAGMARRAINASREAMDAALTFDDPKVHEEVSKEKKLVFLTGATGIMGQETRKQLLSRKNRFRVRILARPSEKNRVLLKKYACPSLEIIWGDMGDYDTIKRCVDGADYVLHIGDMVSPAADRYPEKTLYTNIGSTLNIIKAIKEQPDPDKVHFAYVGTVAMTGGRTEPVHWGRVGDPINPSIFDYYALSKVYSELAVYESGICMANLCEEWVPEDFWRKGYNLSSGARYRLATWELMDLNLGAFGLGLKDLFDSNMIAQYNFHGHYFSDGDKLDDILHFRCIPAEQYWGSVREEMRRMAANPLIRSMFPSGEQMKAHNIKIGHKRMGTYWMFENNEEDWIKAFFGSREKQKAIKDVDTDPRGRGRLRDSYGIQRL